MLDVGQDAREKGVEGDAVGKGALHDEVGGGEDAAKGKAAGVIFRVLFESHDGEQATHGVAHEKYLVGRAVFFAEVAAEGLGFCGSLGDGPSADSVTGAGDSVAAVENFLEDARGRVFGIEGLRGRLVAVEVKDEATVPVFGDVNAEGRVIEEAGFGAEGNRRRCSGRRGGRRSRFGRSGQRRSRNMRFLGMCRGKHEEQQDEPPRIP